MLASAAAVALAIALAVAAWPLPIAGASRTHGAAHGPHEYGCPMLPAGNALNEDISKAPLNPLSNAYIASIGASLHLHADFGTNPSYGIPYVVVGPHQPRVPIHFSEYGAESEPGPYPVPLNAPVEGAGEAGDRHVLVLQTHACKLYELYSARRAGAGWEAGSGAVFNLRSNALRPEGWTSADAAGLPILPGLARWDGDASTGHIAHALRFTVARTRRAYTYPARHFASDSTDPTLPPMGLRVRLKANVDITKLPPQARIVAQAMKTYGLILADNGSNWYVSGAPSPHWSNDQLHALGSLTGADFEVVDTSGLRP
jgi:hypothetical protein